jgi:hypothetical protein
MKEWLVNDELEMIWKEAVVAYVEALFRHLTECNEENHGKPQSGQPVSGPIFEPSTSEVLTTKPKFEFDLLDYNTCVLVGGHTASVFGGGIQP